MWMLDLSYFFLDSLMTSSYLFAVFFFLAGKSQYELFSIHFLNICLSSTSDVWTLSLAQDAILVNNAELFFYVTPWMSILVRKANNKQLLL